MLEQYLGRIGSRLGHSSIQVTLDTYSHVAPGIREKAAARLDEIFETVPIKNTEAVG